MIAAALLIVLLSMDNPGVLWSVLLVLLAGLAVVIAVSPGAADPSDGGVGDAANDHGPGGPRGTADTAELTPVGVGDESPTTPSVPLNPTLLRCPAQGILSSPPAGRVVVVGPVSPAHLKTRNQHLSRPPGHQAGVREIEPAGQGCSGQLTAQQARHR